MEDDALGLVFGEVAKSHFQFIGEGIFLWHEGDSDRRQGRLGRRREGDIEDPFEVGAPGTLFKRNLLKAEDIFRGAFLRKQRQGNGFFVGESAFFGKKGDIDRGQRGGLGRKEGDVGNRFEVGAPGIFFKSERGE